MTSTFLMKRLAGAGLGILLLFSVWGCSGGGGGASAGPIQDPGPQIPVSENSAPVANAGPDQGVATGATVMLNGGGTYDLDGDPLKFAWTLTSMPVGSSAALSNADTAYPTITVDVAGSYVVSLVVSDGLATSNADTAVITASPNSGGNTAPVAYAGPDQHSGVGTRVTLDGSASYDIDRDSLTYHWYLTSKPIGSNAALSNPFIINPTFTPDVPGVYTVSLVVNDGTVDSSYDSATITASLTAVANAGPDRYSLGGANSEITLNGSFSYDSTGKPLTYTWSFLMRPVGSTADFVDPHAVQPSFTADEEGKYVVQLVVNNGYANSAPDTVTISVTSDKTIAWWNFNVIDAEYSKQLDRIIMISNKPGNQLHIYDPVTGADTAVDLAYDPSNVSVTPDGLYAAVSHFGIISYVDLTTHAVVKFLATAAGDLSDVLLAGNGYVYAFPLAQFSRISCVNVATGVVYTPNSGPLLYANTRAKLLPGSTILYAAGDQNIQKFDISTGTAAFLYDSSFAGGSYRACGDFWMAEDGTRFFSKCGNIFPASTGKTRDLTPSGSIPGLRFVRHLSHLAQGDKLAAIPEYNSTFNTTSDDRELWLLGSGALEKIVPLPMFAVNGLGYVSHGRFVFYNSAGTKIFVVVQADTTARLTNDYGIITY